MTALLLTSDPYFIIDWNQFVTNKLWTWEQTNLAWAKNFTGDILIVYYDQLVDDVEGTLRDILKFIDFSVDEVRCIYKCLV